MIHKMNKIEKQNHVNLVNPVQQKPLITEPIMPTA
jgi:hypothetical protein